MILKKAIAAAALGIRPTLATTSSTNHTLLSSQRHLSYSIDICKSIIAIANTPVQHSYLQDNNNATNSINDIYENGEEFECELSSGLTVPLRGPDEQITQLQDLLNDGNGTFVSGEMTVAVATDLINEEGDDSVYLPPGEIIVAPRQSRSLRGQGSHRGLAQQVYKGKKPILAVKVTDSGGLVHPDSANMISDKIFGTSGDKVNIKSQLEACSHDKLQVTNEYDINISDKLAAPGVIEIDIPISLGNDRRAIRTELIRATQNKLGLALPGPFQNVMFVLEGCYKDCGWAAYAYINGWLSIYQGDNYKYSSVQLHEIGHNLNLAHSGGLNGRAYSDHSCTMGNPYYEDEGGIMCFNPSKNYQLSQGHGGWYNDHTYDTKTFATGVYGGTSWLGQIIGIDDYKNNPNHRPVVVKIESGTSTDLFVGFNRASGINRDTADARNQVTITQAGNNGLGYSQSWLKAKLSEGETYTVPNWRNGIDLSIHVKEINLSAEPSYANVFMTYGDQNIDSPTKRPTTSPIYSGSDDSECGDSICEMTEGSESCPADCSRKELVTTFDFNLGSSGNMFSVEALRDLAISSLVINAMSKGQGEVKVYSRNGSYTSHELNSQGWELIYSNPTVVHKKRGQPTELGDFSKPVMIKSGSIQSFFVHSSKSLVYTAGTQEGVPFASDDSIVIFEGIGTTDKFDGRTYSPRVWGGIVRYDVHQTQSAICGDNVCEMTEDSRSCPADCSGKEISTTFDFNLGSSGNMFSVLALRDVSVTSLVINAMSKGRGEVKVYTRNGSYTGHELSSQGWELIYSNQGVVHKKRGQPTELEDFSKPVLIKSGSIQSFFVHSSNSLVYTAGTKEGDTYTSDESFVICEGIGTTGIFSGATYSPRVWGGIIRYDLN